MRHYPPYTWFEHSAKAALEPLFNALDALLVGLPAEAVMEGFTPTTNASRVAWHFSFSISIRSLILDEYGFQREVTNAYIRVSGNNDADGGGARILKLLVTVCGYVSSHPPEDPRLGDLSETIISLMRKWCVDIAAVKCKPWPVAAAATVTPPPTPAEPPGLFPADVLEEVRSALANLGFKKGPAETRINQAKDKYVATGATTTITLDQFIALTLRKS